MSAFRDLIDVIRCVPYIWRAEMGRWHVWRAAPDDLVDKVAGCRDDNGGVISQAKAEMALRKRQQ